MTSSITTNVEIMQADSLLKSLASTPTPEIPGLDLTGFVPETLPRLPTEVGSGSDYMNQDDPRARLDGNPIVTVNKGTQRRTGNISTSYDNSPEPSGSSVTEPAIRDTSAEKTTEASIGIRIVELWATDQQVKQTYDLTQKELETLRSSLGEHLDGYKKTLVVPVVRVCGPASCGSTKCRVRQPTAI